MRFIRATNLNCVATVEVFSFCLACHLQDKSTMALLTSALQSTAQVKMHTAAKAHLLITAALAWPMRTQCMLLCTLFHQEAYCLVHVTEVSRRMQAVECPRARL